jgi:serine/threonine protein kinase
MQVFLEDMSGNGTIVNQTTLLRRGEKRMLHTGDEICLVNPHTLKKKIRSATVLKELLSQHSFVFVNLHQQQPGFTAQVLKSWQMNPPSTVAKKRKPAVNVREIRQHSNYVGKSPAGDIVGWRTLQNRRMANKMPGTGRRVEEEYDIRDLLGSGTVGEVRRAIHRKSGEERAVKIISIGGRNRGLMQVQPTTSLQAEATILQKLMHPYVVQLFDVYPPTASSNNIYLVMELLHGGDLFDRIVEKGRFSEKESRRVMRRLLNAIHYLHEECNIVHRDLKPENILCVHRGLDRCTEVKITDFGLAKAVNGCQESLKTFCGTPQYFAPEVLKRRSTVAGRGRYGKPADMWSLGVILYVLLSGTQPFDVELDDAISVDNQVDGDSKQVQFSNEHWGGISESARDLIRKLLVVDTNSRYNVQQACDHEWMLVDDGDTHVHPLSDPAVVEFRKTISPTRRKVGNEVDLMSKLSVEDSGSNNEMPSSPYINKHQTHPSSRKIDNQDGSCLREEDTESHAAAMDVRELGNDSPQINETPLMAIDPFVELGSEDASCAVEERIDEIAAEAHTFNVDNTYPSSPRKNQVFNMEDIAISGSRSEAVYETPSAPVDRESKEEKDNSSRTTLTLHDPGAVSNDSGLPDKKVKESVPNENLNSLKTPRKLLAFCTPSDRSREFFTKNAKAKEDHHHSLTRRPLSPVRGPNQPESRLQNESNLTTLFDALPTPPTSNRNPARVSDFPNDRKPKPQYEEDDVMSFPSDRAESIASFSSANSKSAPHEIREPCEKALKKRKADAVDTEIQDTGDKRSDRVAVHKRSKKQQSEARPNSMKRQTTLSSWFTKSTN